MGFAARFGWSRPPPRGPFGRETQTSAPWSVQGVCLPPVRARDGVDDREAEPAATRAVRPSGRLKRSKARSRKAEGNPRRPSITWSSTCPSTSRATSRTVPSPWRKAFSTMLRSACSSRNLSATSVIRGGASKANRRPASSARRRKRSTITLEQLSRFVAPGAEREPPLRGARYHEQVLRQLDEAVGVLGGGADRGPDVLGRLLLLEGQLELGAKDGEWRAQLVAGCQLRRDGLGRAR